MDTQTTTEQVQQSMKFIKVDEFKSRINVREFDIVKSPKTGKLFASTSTKNYRVQGDIDLHKPVRYMFADDDFDNGCIVNVIESDNVLATL